MSRYGCRGAKYSESPSDLEITRLDCICYAQACTISQKAAKFMSAFSEVEVLKKK